MLGYFLPVFQESTSLKELDIHFPLIGRLSNMALENMLTYTQSLRYLSLILPVGQLEDTLVAAAALGLKKNTTLRELTLEFSQGASDYLPCFDQFMRPSSPSKSVFAWGRGGYDWTRDSVAKRRLQNHRT
jgi:hypothetical protein